MNNCPQFLRKKFKAVVVPNAISPVPVLGPMPVSVAPNSLYGQSTIPADPNAPPQPPYWPSVQGANAPAGTALSNPQGCAKRNQCSSSSKKSTKFRNEYQDDSLSDYDSDDDSSSRHRKRRHKHRHKKDAYRWPKSEKDLKYYLPGSSMTTPFEAGFRMGYMARYKDMLPRTSRSNIPAFACLNPFSKETVCRQLMGERCGLQIPRCPVVPHSQCPAMPSPQCPGMPHLSCLPLSSAQCPPTSAQCPPTSAQCPPSPPRCPAPAPPQCPALPSPHCTATRSARCPSIPPAQCPSFSALRCPPTSTARCPSTVPPQCPSFSAIRCPPTSTPRCPSIVPQQCPSFSAIRCPIAPTAQCPSLPCPGGQTVPIPKCPSIYSPQCPPKPLAQCPAQFHTTSGSAQCPFSHPQCTLSKATPPQPQPTCSGNQPQLANWPSYNSTFANKSPTEEECPRPCIFDSPQRYSKYLSFSKQKEQEQVYAARENPSCQKDRCQFNDENKDNFSRKIPQFELGALNSSPRKTENNEPSLKNQESSSKRSSDKKDTNCVQPDECLAYKGSKPVTRVQRDSSSSLLIDHAYCGKQGGGSCKYCEVMSNVMKIVKKYETQARDVEEEEQGCRLNCVKSEEGKEAARLLFKEVAKMRREKETDGAKYPKVICDGKKAE